jgi:hypothetical protein
MLFTTNMLRAMKHDCNTQSTMSLLSSSLADIRASCVTDIGPMEYGVSVQNELSNCAPLVITKSDSDSAVYRRTENVAERCELVLDMGNRSPIGGNSWSVLKKNVHLAVAKYSLSILSKAVVRTLSSS